LTDSGTAPQWSLRSTSRPPDFRKNSPEHRLGARYLNQGFCRTGGWGADVRRALALHMGAHPNDATRNAVRLSVPPRSCSAAQQYRPLGMTPVLGRWRFVTTRNGFFAGKSTPENLPLSQRAPLGPPPGNTPLPETPCGEDPPVPVAGGLFLLSKFPALIRRS
jgi:hypothetical protein